MTQAKFLRYLYHLKDLAVVKGPAISEAVLGICTAQVAQLPAENETDQDLANALQESLVNLDRTFESVSLDVSAGREAIVAAIIVVNKRQEKTSTKP